MFMEAKIPHNNSKKGKIKNKKCIDRGKVEKRRKKAEMKSLIAMTA